MRETDTMHTPDRPQHDPLFDPLRAGLQDVNAPPGVEQALMQAFARQFPRRRRWYEALSPRGRAAGVGLAACMAVTALALALFTLHAPRMDGTPDANLDTHPDAARTLAAYDADGGLFIALEPLERIEREPSLRMVETDLPRSSLDALGVPPTPDNAGDAVRAELLVAADGQALALRLIN